MRDGLVVLIRFDPRRIIAALLYVVVERGYRDRIPSEIKESVIAAMEANGVGFEVNRRVWAALTPAERIDWIAARVNGLFFGFNESDVVTVRYQP